MNVCIITSQYPPLIEGGISTSSRRIAKHLALDEFNIHVIAPGMNTFGRPIIPAWEEGITVHRTFPSLLFENGSRDELREIGNYIIELHRKINFDLIHCISLVPAGQIGALVSSETGCPFIVSIHGADLETMRYSPFLLNTVQWVLEQASFTIAPSLKMLCRAKKIASIQNFRVVPSAFDISAFDTSSLHEIALQQKWSYRLFALKFLKKKKKEEPVVVGTVGKIHPMKGFSILMEAFHGLIRESPRAHLLVIGDFVDQNEKKGWLKWTKKNGIYKKVSFTGAIPHSQVLAWIQEMDIFAFPSFYESSFNSLLEAMACGLSVVVSKVDGISDFIKDKENGLLIPPYSVEALEEKLKVLFFNKRLRAKLGKNAQQTVRRQFLPKQESRTWIDIYNQVLCKSKKSK